MGRIEKKSIPISIFSFLLLILYSISNAQLPEIYTTYEEAEQILSDLQDNYPEICKLDTVGYSTRDNVPMMRLKISDNVEDDEDEPAVFYCGGVHADEVLGVEVVMNFIQDILERYGSADPDIIDLINSIELFCVPFINPEGHIVVEEGDTQWRKNKCDNDENGIFDFHDGVDNNRNYDFGWYIDDDPGSNTPESLMYKGTAPFTQTENIAMAEFGLQAADRP
jgi:murein tripeptide amidase MpaA